LQLIFGSHIRNSCFKAQNSPPELIPGTHFQNNVFRKRLPEPIFGHPEFIFKTTWVPALISGTHFQGKWVPELIPGTRFGSSTRSCKTTSANILTDCLRVQTDNDFRNRNPFSSRHATKSTGETYFA